MAKYGARECCDVVFKTKSDIKLGNKQFYAGEPVLYFDTLKTSSLEGQSSTSYATGGKGGARLIAWDGEKTLTFTMEDALISPEGIAILAGAGLIEASSTEPVYVHKTLEMKAKDAGVTIQSGKVSATAITLKDENGDSVTAAIDADHPLFMFIKDSNGYIISEPFSTETKENGPGAISDALKITESTVIPGLDTTDTDGSKFNGTVFFDFYTKETSGVKQIDIGYDKFAGSYYIEASTLFRDQATGRDDPAEFIIPNGKIQTNFTFTMAGTGDPSSFTFTVDALRGRVKGGTTDCLAAIQIIDTSKSGDAEGRQQTNSKN